MGSACTDVSQCAGADVLGAKSCNAPTLSDGGASGWVGGYCQPTCLSTLVTCPGSADYCGTVICYQGCPAPGAGQSTCRTGYVCRNDTTSDGGVLPGTGHCTPNCNNAPAAVCGSRTCLSNGYCN